MTHKTLIIHHANCWDGMGAAWAAVQGAQNMASMMADDVDIDLHPAQYGDDPPDISGYTWVYIVDFSYDRETLQEMYARHEEATQHISTGEFVVLDHHKTAEEDLKGLDFCHFDMDKSGVRLAWEHFFKEELPWFLALIEDRDLWNWDLPDTEPFTLWLFSQPMTLETLDRLDEGGGHLYDKAVEKGGAIRTYRDQTVDNLCQKARLVNIAFDEKPGLEVYAVNTPVLHSKVGHFLAEKSPSGVGMTYYQTKKRDFKFSLRGIGPEDVGRIASFFGGGGHPTAAGFRLAEWKARTLIEDDYLNAQD